MNDVLEADPDIEQALPLDPFGSKPQWSSRITGLGGNEPAPDSSYVFLTLDSRPAIGTVTAQIRFVDLAATCGTLLIELRVRSAFPGAEHSRLQTMAVDLQELARSDGVLELSFESYRNAYYSIAGNINDETDVTASFIGITIDKRATPTEHGKNWGWRAGNGITAKRRTDIESALIHRVIADVGLPRLDQPMSQVGTPLQCREQSFFDAMSALQRPAEPTFENWAMAYIIQATTRFGSDEGQIKMLGYIGDESPLLSYFAAREHEIVGMRHSVRNDDEFDPGRELQRLWVPELCGEADFFSHAHFTAGDIRFPTENFKNQFDVAWSIGANRVMSSQEFVHFAVNGLIALKPGGLAVHVVDYSEDSDRGKDHILFRHDIERLVALALSHWNEAARLQFRHGAPSDMSIGVLPFGIVLLRGGLPEEG